MSLWMMLASAYLAVAQDTTIRTTVPLVVLSTSVTDKHGQPVYGLNASDFVVLDNGKPRRVYAYPTDAALPPVALVVAVQTSGLSSAALAKINKVGAMIPQAVVGENGEAAVLSFDDQVNVVQNFTSDAGVIANAFRGLSASDSSHARMLDAIDVAFEMLASRPGARRASILILGEARDHGSAAKLTTLLEKAQHTGATIYSLNYSAWITPFTAKPGDYQPANGGSPDYIAGFSALAGLAKKKTAEVLTQATGGRRISFETQSKLENELIALGSEMHSRYLIAFSPEQDEQPSFHKLEVEIKDRAGLAIKTRPGYWSGPPSSK